MDRGNKSSGMESKRKHVTIAGVRAIVTAAVAEMAMGIDTKKN